MHTGCIGNFFHDFETGGYVKKFFQISVIVVLALALAFTITGTSPGVAAEMSRPSISWNSNNPNCSINQVLKGNKNADPGCVKPNAGWNS
jgi:hypothetical protein